MLVIRTRHKTFLGLAKELLTRPFRRNEKAPESPESEGHSRPDASEALPFSRVPTRRRRNRVISLSRKRSPRLFSFLVELGVYAGFVLTYFFLVLLLPGRHGLQHVFRTTTKLITPSWQWRLIAVQGVVLERLTTILLWVIRCLQNIVPVLYRLATAV